MKRQTAQSTKSRHGDFYSRVAVQARRLLHDTSGASAIEYAMIAAGIAAVIIGSANALGFTTKDLYNSVVSAMK